MAFEPLSEDDPFPDIEPASLVGRAIAVWLFCAIVAGVALTGAIHAAAKYFESPAFSDLPYLGFVLGGVLGLLVAGISVISALRRGA